jgi:hypothetical protein
VDFYDTAAAVIPVLLLALVFDTKYFDEVKIDKTRANRRVWTKTNVAMWSYFATGTALAALGVCLLIKASVICPCVVGKWLTIVGLAGLIGSLWMRIFVRSTSRQTSPSRTWHSTAGPAPDFLRDPTAGPPPPRATRERLLRILPPQPG